VAKRGRKAIPKEIKFRNRLNRETCSAKTGNDNEIKAKGNFSGTI